MGKLKKISLWFMGTAGVLLVLLLGFLLLVPTLINLEPIREKVLSNISTKIGKKVECERIDLSIFPSPHIVFYQVNLSIPEIATGKAKALHVYL